MMDDSGAMSPEHGRNNNNNNWNRSLTTPATDTTTETIPPPITTSSSPSIENNTKLSNDTDDDIDGRIYQEELKHLMEPQNRPPISRPSRGFRHFQNPPQPHMCIRHHTVDGQELFINVMSWTRIVMPQNADEPIPLYGGMRVPPGSHRSPPLLYAVMANPEILKQVGRNCPDPEKKLALVELMCDFVEAMNPGLKLARDAEVLKDRDLSGELKDIWGAVQAKREREKEVPPYENYLAAQNQVTYMEFGPETAFQKEQQQLQQQINTLTSQQNQQQPIISSSSTHSSSALTSFVEMAKSSAITTAITGNPITTNSSSSVTASNTTTNSNTTVDGSANSNSEQQLHNGNGKAATKTISSNKDNSINLMPKKTEEKSSSEKQKVAAPSSSTLSTPNTAVSTKTGPSPSLPVNVTSTTPTTNNTANTTTSTPPTSTKKEKLGGFLPNGCHNIFPFIKSKNSQKSEGKVKVKKGSSTGGSHWKKGGGAGVVAVEQQQDIVTNGSTIHNNTGMENGSKKDEVSANSPATIDSKMQKLKL